jgi:hypothetical protein
MRLSWVLSGLLITAMPVACSNAEAPPDLGDEDDEAVHSASEEAKDEPRPLPSPEIAMPAEPSDAGVDAGPVCSLMTAPKATYLKYGLHPAASNALQMLKFTAARLIQTIGNDPSSAGTHAKDGTVEGRDYAAATDLSVSGMTDAQVKVLLDQMATLGFVPYYRAPGQDGWNGSRHIHAIYAGAPMKLSVRNQVRDWYAGKNGLVSHTEYKFHTWDQCTRDAVWRSFVAHNPAAADAGT